MPVELSHDEVHTIMTFLPQSDLLNVMDAGPTLHELGLPVLLRSPITIPLETLVMNRVLQLSGLPGLVELHGMLVEFDISRLSSIGHLLRDLRIRLVGRRSAAHRGLLLDNILRAATGLHTLDLHGYNDFYHLFPELSRLIGSLTNLRRLGLSKINQSMCTEVMEYSLPLTHVYITFRGSGGLYPIDTLSEEELSKLYGFAPMLKRCSATLESIHLDDVDFRSIAELVFPCVHTFGVERLEFGVRRSTLVRHFPRLSTLYIGGLSSYPEEATSYIQWHTINSSDPLQWPHLGRLHISPCAIYTLNLRCTSQFLCIDSLQFSGHGLVTDHHTLVNCHPMSISMRAVGDCLNSLQVFLHHSPQLTHIGIQLYDEISGNVSDAYEAFDRVYSSIEALRSSSCTHLFVNFLSYMIDADMSALLPCWQHRCMFAQQLVDTISSLQSIHLRLELIHYYPLRHQVITWLGEVANIAGRRIVQQVEELQEVPEPLAAYRSVDHRDGKFRWK
ncbi:hypothetical protein K474DRAFT_800866 [Panus rudis PR-1116 ss-1]|nr:hypothetical protein K474DRAFT_800866 [Panus rudis PR-1116 ss-1]